MKRFLFSLVALAITSVCLAQDIIVKKDGSTIQAKVLNVTQYVVEYKIFRHQNGPTYTFSITDLRCINYENGTTKMFHSPDGNSNTVTNETATQYSNDNNLLAIYSNLNKKQEKPKKIVTPEMLHKKGKRMKTFGYAVGGTLLVGGIVAIIVGASQDKYDYEKLYASDNYIHHYKYYNLDRNPYFYVGYGAMAGGVAVGAPLILRGRSLQKKSREQVHAVSAISQDIHFGNGSSLNLGIDLLSSNFSFVKAPGIGVRYNF